MASSETNQAHLDDLNPLVPRPNLLSKASRRLRIANRIVSTMPEQKRQVLRPSVPACRRIERHTTVEHVGYASSSPDRLAEGVFLHFLGDFGIM